MRQPLPTRQRQQPLPEKRPKPGAEDPDAPAKIKTIVASPSYREADQDPDFLARDDMRGVRGHAHLPGPGHAAVAIECGDAVDEGLLRLALLQPARARALRILIGEQRMVALTREITGEIRGYRRFTRAPFRVQDENSLHVLTSVRSPRHHSKGVIPLTPVVRALT